MQDGVDRRRGERCDIRKALDETLIVRNDGRHLRLLQHDLGDPDAVRRALLLPGKIVPAAPCVPFNESVGKARVRGLHAVILATADSRSNFRSA